MHKLLPMSVNTLSCEMEQIDNMFSAGQPAQYIPHTRAKCKPLLMYNNNLYSDTNVKVGKNGTHYFKCIEASKGCPATAHTKVFEGVDYYFKEMPNEINHTCHRGPLHLHAVKFAAKVYQICTETLETRHPALYYNISQNTETSWKLKKRGTGLMTLSQRATPTKQ